MALFIGLKIENDVDYDRLISALKEIGIKTLDEVDENPKSFVYAMSTDSKFLVELSEFTDEEIADEFYERDF